MYWNPVISLDTSLSISIDKKLSEIAILLNNQIHSTLENNSIGLFNGNIGIANFFFYYSHYSKNSSLSENSMTIINNVFHYTENYACLYDLSSGIAGICWGLTHFAKYNFLKADTDEILEAINDPLFQ